MTHNTKIAARKGNKIVVVREGKVYGVIVDANQVVLDVTSCNAAGNFKRYSEDRCPALFADIQAAL